MRISYWSSDVCSSDLNYLHGHTALGVPLTLVGQFSSDGHGFSFNHGMTYWTATNYPFHYGIFDQHFEDSDTFDSFQFDISGVQEFFAPDDMKIRIPHSATEVVVAEGKVGKVSVIHSSRFSFVGPDLNGFFYTEDADALSELQLAYADICRR